MHAPRYQKKSELFNIEKDKKEKKKFQHQTNQKRIYWQIPIKSTASQFLYFFVRNMIYPFC